MAILSKHLKKWYNDTRKMYERNSSYISIRGGYRRKEYEDYKRLT
jgi:hypothetical protein